MGDRRAMAGSLAALPRRSNSDGSDTRLFFRGFPYLKVVVADTNAETRTSAVILRAERAWQSLTNLLHVALRCKWSGHDHIVCLSSKSFVARLIRALTFRLKVRHVDLARPKERS